MPLFFRFSVTPHYISVADHADDNLSLVGETGVKLLCQQKRRALIAEAASLLNILKILLSRFLVFIAVRAEESIHRHAVKRGKRWQKHYIGISGVILPPADGLL